SPAAPAATSVCGAATSGGAAFEEVKLDALGDVVCRTTLDGAGITDRDGLGLLRRKVIDADGLALTTRYDYDFNGNVRAVFEDVHEHFDASAASRGIQVAAPYWRTTKTVYDVLNRPIRRSVGVGSPDSAAAFVAKSTTTTDYWPSGDPRTVTAPALDDKN